MHYCQQGAISVKVPTLRLALPSVTVVGLLCEIATCHLEIRVGKVSVFLAMQPTSDHASVVISISNQTRHGWPNGLASAYRLMPASIRG
jgi:hypothetical protein